MSGPYCCWPHAPIKRIRAQFRVTPGEQTLALVEVENKLTGRPKHRNSPVITPINKEWWCCVRHLSLGVAAALDQATIAIIHDNRES